ncbi:MAG: PqiC family protein [Ostreibacterium sp.]
MKNNIIVKQLKKKRSSFIVLLLTILIMGCASKPLQQEYFLLNNSHQADISMIAGEPQVSIRRVKLPQYLRKHNIVREMSDGKVQFSSTQFWVERLSQAIPNVLAQEMTIELQSPVEVHPLPPETNVRTIVEVDISQLLADDRELVLQTSYRMIKPKKLETRHFLTKVALLDDKTMTLVKAHQTALKRLAVDIAKHL